MLKLKQIYIKIKSIIMSEMYDELLPNEVLLMPKQATAFNGDSYVANEFLKLKEEFDVSKIIECGSCVGGTTKWMGANFENVVSIEINEQFRNICLERIKDFNNIISILGNSVDHLHSILKSCEDNTILYLDDHWGDFFPLFNELRIIKESGLKPIIVIHDCKVPDEPNLGFDSYNGVDISYENIKSYLEDIYGIDGYDYYYNSDEESTEVKRGVIYIKPKTNEQKLD